VLPDSALGMFQGNTIQLDLKPELRGAAASAKSCLQLLADHTGFLSITIWRFDRDTAGSSGTAQAQRHAEANLPLDSQAISGVTDEAWWTDSRCMLTARSRNLLFRFEAEPVDESGPVSDCRSRFEPLAREYLQLHT
jgi:hypothetical protein